jgi:UDP-N-acetylglucosamine 2-epimerase
LKLLSQAKVLVGNSSAGLIEAPSLNVTTVNVGPRQQGREKAKSVIDTGYDQKQIKNTVAKGLKTNLKKVANPYGDGKTTERVLNFLSSL